MADDKTNDPKNTPAASHDGPAPGAGAGSFDEHLATAQADPENPVNTKPDVDETGPNGTTKAQPPVEKVDPNVGPVGTDPKTGLPMRDPNDVGKHDPSHEGLTDIPSTQLPPGTVPPTAPRI